MTFSVVVLAGFGCLLVHGLLAIAETSLVAADRGLLAEGAAAGKTGPTMALDLLRQEHMLAGTTLLGIVATLVLFSTITACWLHGIERSIWYTVAIVAPLTIVFGEALPRILAKHHANVLATLVARPLRALQVILTPFVWVLAGLGRWLHFRTEPVEISREEIVRLIDESAPGDIDAEDRQLIRRIFSMTETQIDDCMTPLVEVAAIDEELDVDETIQFVKEGGFSRLPVYRDRIDNIVGFITLRDLLFNAEDSDTVGKHMQPAMYVPETKGVDDLLREMRRDQNHFAVVVDEYGGVVGVVTVEDLLEEIVGEIQDERDTEEPGIRRLSEREWLIPARLEIEEISDVIGVDLPEGEYETVAGLILAAVGRIPETGEVIRIRRFAFRIELATERAIQRVHL
ncbi:MAG: HlyC/CorC family transporter, partial [Proteobacteria bacterium]|nr:HlyC/CorC family transporter [Pseudomonadota bacterium]